MKKLLLIIIVLLMSGCYDYNDLSKMDLISTIIVDKNDDGYVVYLEILETSDNAKVGSHYVSGNGRTLESALINVYRQSRFSPFYAHMSAFVVSESVAKDDLEDFYDYLLRDTDFRKGFSVFVTENIDSILEFTPKKDESFGKTAQDLAENIMKKSGIYKTSTFREIIYHYLRDNTYYIGSIEVKDKNVILGDTYLFDHNKLAFKVEPEAVLFANGLYGQNELFQIEDENTYVIHEYEIERDVKKDKITLTLNGSVRLQNVRINGSLKEDDLVKLEKELNEHIENRAKDIIDYSRRKDTDLFNFNYFYFMYYPRNLKDDTWKRIDYEFKSDLRIREKGMLLEAIEGGQNGK